jgi:CRP-like cAMP-binding protein
VFASTINIEELSSLFRQHIRQFGTFTDAEWAALQSHITIVQLPKREQFVRIGETSGVVGFVVRGSLRQYYITGDGDERTTYFFFEGALVAGYISLVGKRPSLVAIEAMEDAQLLTFPYAVLESLYNSVPAWERFGRNVAEYLVLGLEERLIEHLMYSPEERYHRLLASNRTKIMERVPQQYVASYLGITPVSLSRIRARN